MARSLRIAASAMLAIAVLTGANLISSPAANAAPKQNQKLLTFSATTVDGLAYKSTPLLKKPSVIWFWTPWCAICRNESADISKLSIKYAGKVNFLGIGANGSVDEMKEFVALQPKARMAQLNDAQGKLWSRFGVVIQPTVVFVDKNGKIETHIGPSTSSYLAKKIARLIR